MLKEQYKGHPTYNSYFVLFSLSTCVRIYPLCLYFILQLVYMYMHIYENIFMRICIYGRIYIQLFAESPESNLWLSQHFTPTYFSLYRLRIIQAYPIQVAEMSTCTYVPIKHLEFLSQAGRCFVIVWREPRSWRSWQSPFQLPEEPSQYL